MSQIDHSTSYDGAMSLVKQFADILQRLLGDSAGRVSNYDKLSERLRNIGNDPTCPVEALSLLRQMDMVIMAIFKGEHPSLRSAQTLLQQAAELTAGGQFAFTYRG